MHKVPRTAESEHGRLWQRACAQLWPSPSALRQLLRQPLLSMPSGLDAGLAFAEGQLLERWQYRAQRVPSNARLVSYRPATAIKAYGPFDSV